LGLLALLILIGAGTGGYLWTQSQYFVGTSGNEVAVFRGVNTEFGPIKLFSTITNSHIKVADLTPVARNQVENGITARSRNEAEAIVARLGEELLPVCPSPAAASPSPTPTHSAKKSASPKPSAKSGAKSSAARPSPSPSATPTPSTTDLPVAGVTCRRNP
jgi:protein phosphatase